MVPYLKKGRNVMADNFFTSEKHTEKLKAEDTVIVYIMKLFW
jgi:hypothetical protein